MLNTSIGRGWLAGFLIALVLTPAGLFWLDVPIAAACVALFSRLQHVGSHLGAPLLVTGETLVATLLAGYRIARGRLPELAKVTVVACATSLCAFALNEVVLKTIFGMAPPFVVLNGAPHVFHFFQGSWESSFPSGHMTLASGFVATFVGQKKPLVLLLSAGLLLAALLLVLGDWHFLSDVVAGTLVGGTAGVLAAALWRQDRLRLRAEFQPADMEKRQRRGPSI